MKLDVFALLSEFVFGHDFEDHSGAIFLTEMQLVGALKHLRAKQLAIQKTFRVIVHQLYVLGIIDLLAVPVFDQIFVAFVLRFFALRELHELFFAFL